jgi:hypothetical protein
MAKKLGKKERAEKRAREEAALAASSSDAPADVRFLRFTILLQNFIRNYCLKHYLNVYECILRLQR